MDSPLPPRKPDWIRTRAPAGEEYARLKRIVRAQRLRTVCEEALCPNLGECWSRGTATFMILGGRCTRDCRFCAVEKGAPSPSGDGDEPDRIARAVMLLGLRHAVVTSVSRDDLPDGGASVFGACVRRIRAYVPRCTVEVLIPDFEGRWSALDLVLSARPDVLNHNIETVPRLYPDARKGAGFERSLELLARAKTRGLFTKSGLMTGLGESWRELLDTIRAIRLTGADALTIGQYLSPSTRHLPVARYYSPEEFRELREVSIGMGFRHVESGPLVRSSYHAEEQCVLLKTGR
ncbi:MAG: lipoyl synthase [Vicinamibacteria bacterium]|nr:lipoyl synthase [Vicinamibacteria bacterium]